MFSLKPGHCFVLLLTLSALAIPAAAQVVCTPVFINEYLGTANTPLQPHALKPLPDGTTLVVGRAAQPGSTTYDGWISKWAGDGTPVWSFFVGGTGNDDLTGITPLNDGSFLCFGTTTSFGHPEGKGWLIRIDGNGAILWSCQLGSSSVSTDRIKAIQQYSDGDLLGTLNMNDSSAASDPVVFKLGLDATLRWVQRVDDGDDDSFTTLAVSGDTLYAGGYYTAGGMRHGVISAFSAVTGAVLRNETIGNGDATLNGQVTGLEIYNKEISFGLYVNKGTAPNAVNGILLVQTDLVGQPRSVVYNNDPHNPSLLTCKRTADSGFYVLRANNAGTDAPSITKISWYGAVDWNRDLYGSGGFATNNTTFSAFDRTADAGVVTAGHYYTFLTPYGERATLIRLTSRGEAGTCSLSADVTYAGPATMTQNLFTWAAQPAFVSLTTQPTPATASDVPVATPNLCSSSVCLDQTPIPTGCGKTFNIQYISAERTLLEDAVAMPDGGKVTVGEYGSNDGLVTRYQSNGAIAWSHNYNISGHTMQFMRVLATADGNLLVIGNDSYVQTNYVYDQTILLKLDYSGNVLSCNFTSINETQMIDAVATPDNGFVVAFNDNISTEASEFAWVARFDANANLIWKKQVTHGNLVAINRSIACSQDAVFVGYDSWDPAQYDRFGVDRLDLKTGSLVYSQVFTAGSGTTSRVNGVFTVGDSAYVFVYRFTTGWNNLMAGLDKQGNLFLAQNLGTDQLDLSLPAIYATMPSVTITPDQDFWLANRVTVSGTDYLEVSRIKRDGTVELNKLHTGINGYLPFEVRPQGKGLVVVGATPAPKTGDVDFFNAYVLKLDSSGQLQTGAAANCVATDRAYPVSPCTTCAAASFVYGPPAAVDGYPPTTSTGAPYNQNNDLTAVLYCYQPATCNTVNVLQKGPPCALRDTLVYYLDNSANCGAAATWSYDSNYFRPALISGDSIQLIIQKAGVTSVTAQVEGYCQSFTTITPANIVLSQASALPADTLVCAHGPVTIHVSGFDSYLWNDNSTADSLPVSVTGTYSVVATDQCGAQHSTVNIVISPVIHLGNDTSICFGDSVLLDAGPGFTSYQWTGGASTEQIYVHTPGQYLVSATSQGCVTRDSVVLDSVYEPKPVLDKNSVICVGQPRKLSPAGGPYASYLWSDGSSGASLVASSAGTYWVQVTEGPGCVASDTVKLALEHCLVGLFVPNAFTPDGNGHNELFRPLIYGSTKLLEFAVYDRWGQRVFETKTPQAGWDGTVGGHAVPAGTYAWYCSYELQGTVTAGKGTVILIR